jgi:NADP-dependent 3-hydroxy acid dehydrogenase YdfG
MNNAGLADARNFKEVDLASYAHEIDVNLKC